LAKSKLELWAETESDIIASNIIASVFFINMSFLHSVQVGKKDAN
jgi:hypothetical protein